MRRDPSRALAALLVLAGAASAQFGKNKVQYAPFDWRTVPTEHFDLNFAQGGERIAAFAADTIETLYARVRERTGMRLLARVPYFLHPSHPSFQQTNVVDDLLDEGTGGFTELFQNRVVLPFDGSYPAFAHVLAHEMVHAAMFDEFASGSGGSRLAGALRSGFPLWFSEGLAEYASLGWDRGSEWWLADAVTSGYLPSPAGDIQGFLAYRAGQNFLFFLDQAFGPGTVRRLTEEALKRRSLDQAFREVVRLDLRDAGELWIRELRGIYWPELGRRENSRSAGRKLTKAGEDGSFWNMRPAPSPDGTRVAWYSDRGSRQGLYVARLDDLPREAPKLLVSGGGSASHESFNPFGSGPAWSPDGRRLVLASLSGGRHVLRVVDARNGRERRNVDPRLDALANPDWSPDGRFLAFRGLKDGRADLWLWDLESNELRRLTDDDADDAEPVFSPGGGYLAFASDRDDAGLPTTSHDLWRLDLRSGTLLRLTSDPADDVAPSWAGRSDDSSWIVFQSDRCGLPEAYRLDAPGTDSARERPLTNMLAGIQSPRVSRDGHEMVATLFEGGAFDLYRIDPSRVLPDSILPPTRFQAAQSDTSLRLFRPLHPELLESWRPDSALPRAGPPAPDSMDSVRSAPRAALDSTDAPAPPAAPGDRLFGPVPERGRPERAPDSSRWVPDDTAKAFRPDLPRRDADGRPLSEPLRNRFTVETAALAVGGGYASSGGTEVAGAGYLVLSDLPGDQRVVVSLDAQGSLEDASAYVQYGWLPWQTDLFATASHVRTYMSRFRRIGNRSDTAVRMEDTLDLYWADRTWSASLSFEHPTSRFHRFEGGLTAGDIDRVAMIVDDDGNLVEDDDRRGDDASLPWLRTDLGTVWDNALWGPTGPVQGFRGRLGLSWMPPAFDDRYAYVASRADLRAYLPLGHGLHSFALRASAGSATGAGARANPWRFLVGGDAYTFNWHTNRYNAGTDLADVHFSGYDLPLRGYRYLQFRGTNAFLLNAEYRFPFVEQARFGVLLPDIRWLMGTIFVDWGGAWTSGPWQDQTGVGLGYGLRMNLGSFVLRWSIAWPQVQPKGYAGNLQPANPSGSFQYWSLGGEF